MALDEIVIREVVTAASAALEMLVLDRCPGMRNIVECLRDGFFTAGTAGSALGLVAGLLYRDFRRDG